MHGTTKLQKGLNCLFILLFTALVGCTMSCVGPTIHELVELTGKKEWISMVFPLRSAGQLAGSLLSGPLIQLTCKNKKLKFMNIHRVIMFGAILLGGSFFLVPIVRNEYIQLILSFFTTFGLGISFVCVPMSIQLIYKSKRVSSMLLQSLFFFLTFGIFFYPVIISLVFNQEYHYQVNLFIIFYIPAVLLFIVSLVLQFIPAPEITSDSSSEKKDDQKDKKSGLKSILAKMCSKKTIFRMLFSVSGCLFQSFSSASDGVFLYVSFYYGVKIGLSKSTASLIVSLFNFWVLLFRFFGQFIPLVLPPQRLIIVDLLVGQIAFFVFAAYPTNHIALVLVAVFGGSACATLIGSLYSLPTARFDFKYSEMEHSALVLGGSIAQFLVGVALRLMQKLGTLYLPVVILVYWNCAAVVYVVHYFLGILIQKEQQRSGKIKIKS